MAKKPKKDLFDNQSEVRSIFDKDRNHWSADDYKAALGSLNDGLMKFRFLMLDRKTVLSPAYMALSPRAAKLYQVAVNATCFPDSVNQRTIQKHEDTSGWVDLRPLSLPFNLPYNLGKAFNVGNDRQIRDAFQELISLEFIKQIGVSRRNYPNVYKHVSEFLGLSWEEVRSRQNQLSAKRKIKDSCRIDSLEHAPCFHIDSLELFSPIDQIVSKMPFCVSSKGYEQVLTYH